MACPPKIEMKNLSLNLYHILLLAAISFIIIGAVHADGLVISNVTVKPASFNPTLKEKVKISYFISRASSVTITIYDADDGLIQNLAPDKNVPAGVNSILWDGKDVVGKIVPDEAYYFTIEATDERGAKAILDPKAISGGEKIFLPVSRLNPKEGCDIRYELPKAARIQIRVGIHDGPLLKTICDWQPRTAGKHIEKWDGMDGSGVVDVLNQAKYRMTISAFALPENSIIAVGNKEIDYSQYKQSSVRKIKPMRRRIFRKANIHNHYVMPRKIDRAPEFKLELPGNITTDNRGVPVVRGELRIKITLDKVSTKILNELRYEIVLYVDNILHGEEEQGYSPYNWVLPTTRLKNGDRFITVNIATLTGQVGTATMKVKVEN